MIFGTGVPTVEEQLQSVDSSECPTQPQRISQLHEYSHKAITACTSFWVRIWFETRYIFHQALLCEDVHLLWKINMSFSVYSQVKWTFGWNV